MVVFSFYLFWLIFFFHFSGIVFSIVLKLFLIQLYTAKKKKIFFGGQRQVIVLINFNHSEVLVTPRAKDKLLH